MKQQRILVVDDEPDLREILQCNLENAGYSVDTAASAEEALELLSPDHSLILLDVMMGGMSGFRMADHLRKDLKNEVPIIFLTARDTENDLLTGFSAGADDYIAKPFSPREVVARVKVVLRRIHEMGQDNQATHLVLDNLDIDMNAYIVKLDGKVVPCTPKEIEILWTLASNPGMVFSREHLLQSIWGYDFLGDTRAVDSHIKRIRAKLCKPTNNWDIRTVWGVGYRFETLS